MPHEDGSLTIGDFSRDGLLQIVDRSWDHNGTLTVTVREMIGGAEQWVIGWPGVKRKMQRFARRALSHPEQTRHCRFVRRFDDEGCTKATFRVSRLP